MTRNFAVSGFLFIFTSQSNNMLTQNLFIIVATAIFFVFAILWNKRNWLNVLVKLMFTLMTIYGGILILLMYGFILRK